MRPGPAVPDRFGLFTAAQALDAGWTRSALNRACARGDIVRIRHGRYLPAADFDASVEGRRRAAAVAAAAAVLAVERSVASHRSSAVLDDLPVLSLPIRPCLTMPAGTSGTVTGAHLHRAALLPQDVAHHGAIRRTGTARTIVDIARECGAEEALVVADAALRRGLITAERLAEVVDSQRGVPGVATARALLPYVDGRSESPLESVSRLRLARAGLPRAELQATLTDRRGSFLARTDFYWDDYGVVGEADGLAKYTALDSLVQEKLRQERLENCGLVVVRWGWCALIDMDSLVHRLRVAFERGSRASGHRKWLVQRGQHRSEAACFAAQTSGRTAT